MKLLCIDDRSFSAVVHNEPGYCGIIFFLVC